MRNLTLILLIFFTLSCTKDEFNPSKPKDGQIVQLFVDHYWSTDDSKVFLSKDLQPSPMSLRDFTTRESGYTYQVQARVYIPDIAPQDGPDKWLIFEQVISKEKYTGTDPFEISLKQHNLFNSGLAFRKVEGKFMYAGDYELRPANQNISDRMDDLLLLTTKLQQNDEYAAKAVIRAIVTHDPENIEKAYLVQDLKLENLSIKP